MLLMTILAFGVAGGGAACLHGRDETGLVYEAQPIPRR